MIYYIYSLKLMGFFLAWSISPVRIHPSYIKLIPSKGLIQQCFNLLNGRVIAPVFYGFISNYKPDERQSGHSE